MILNSLRVAGFRNLLPQSVEFGRGVNFFVGRNGQGKTNLLEAVFLLALVRSFRTSKLSELVAWTGEEASVTGVGEDRLGLLEIGVTLGRTRRTAYLNGSKVGSAAQLVGRMPCVGFSPADLALVKGSPQGRRQFLDRHSVDLLPSLLTPLVNYHRALKSKNVLLKQGVDDPRVLDPWNAIMAHEAATITVSKRRFISLLETRARELHARFSGDSESLGLELSTGIASGWGEEQLFEELTRLRRREMTARTSLLGPHRDDLVILLAGRDARAFASQGQSRSIVLSLKLAVIELIEAEQSESPLVLLDDADSELDRERGDAFFGMMLSHERQVLITSTTAYTGILDNGRGSARFCVEGGAIVRTG